MAEEDEQPQDLSGAVLGGSELCFELFCNPCDEEGRHAEAIGFCKDCTDFLCDECFRSHCRARPFRRHVLLNRQSMPKDNSLSFKGAPKDMCTDACPKHSDRMIEHYCHEHDTLACSACAFADHRTCQNVDGISNVANGIDKKNEFKYVIDHLKDFERQSCQIKQTSEESMIVSEENTSAVIASIQTYTAGVISKSQQLQTDLESEVKRLQLENRKRLEAAASNIDATLLEIRGILNLLLTLQKNSQSCNLFVALKRAKKRLPLVEQDITRTERDTRVDRLKFDPEMQLQNILWQQGALGEITASRPTTDNTSKELITPSIHDSRRKSKTTAKSGEILDSLSTATRLDHSNETDASVRHTTKPPANDSPSIEPSHRNRESCAMRVNVNARHLTDISVRCMRNDRDHCWITGMTVLSDDKLVTVDSHNHNVKVIDTRKRTVIHVHDVKQSPWDVTSIGTDKLAITIPNTKTIEYLKVSKFGRLSDGGKITVNGKCRSIVFSGNMLWVAFTFPAMVEALTQDGKVQFRVENYVFKSPNSLAVSPGSDVVYVTDSDNIISLSPIGEVLSVSRHWVYWATGTVVTADRTIYVGCNGFHSRGVYMLTSRDEKVQRLLYNYQVGSITGGGVWSLAYNETDRLLFLGTQYCTEIYVYQIEESACISPGDSEATSWQGTG